MFCQDGCSCDCCANLHEGYRRDIDDYQNELKYMREELDYQKTYSGDDYPDSAEKLKQDLNVTIREYSKLEYRTNQEINKLKGNLAVAQMGEARAKLLAEQTAKVHAEELQTMRGLHLEVLSAKLADMHLIIKTLRKGPCDPVGPCDLVENGADGTFVCSYHDYVD